MPFIITILITKQLFVIAHNKKPPLLSAGIQLYTTVTQHLPMALQIIINALNNTTELNYNARTI